MDYMNTGLFAFPDPFCRHLESTTQIERRAVLNLPPMATLAGRDHLMDVRNGGAAQKMIARITQMK
ncbi:MAG: hypothetical protein JW943_09400 [Deltaproteobacteria bacterium]|nr:hypothetical protein [Deltaproteobacteria bacterium]